MYEIVLWVYENTQSVYVDDNVSKNLWEFRHVVARCTCDGLKKYYSLFIFHRPPMPPNTMNG